MSVQDKVSVFTTTMRTEFQVAFEATAVPAEFEKITMQVPSTARIEHYTWMSPTPGIARYKGHRRYGKIDVVKYDVENLEFDNGFEVKLRDVKDDQTGGYMLKPKELAERAKKFPGRYVLKTLGLGSTLPCFDGTNFFATSHEIGSAPTTGTYQGNLLSYTAASADSVSHRFCMLVSDGVLKPMIWQNRMPPEFRTNAGDSRSFESKTLRYWIDMEGNAAFGYWWDAIMVNITNTPTITELQTILGVVENQFRTFTLPKSLSSEDGEYIHEQKVFSAENATIVCSTKLANLFRQVLNQDAIIQAGAAVTNIFKGFASYIPSAFMNP